MANTKLTYRAPTMSRLSVGETAAATAANSDVAVFQNNTAFGPPAAS